MISTRFVPSFTAVAFSFVLGCTALAQEPRLANVSTLTRVGSGDDVLTAGFVINGTAPKQVVIRAVGPTLGAAPFNVGGVLADPQLTVFGPNSSTTVAAANDNWAAANAANFAAVGAFALQANSRDAAVVATLQPGSYTAQVSGVGGTTGTAIVEVYEVGAPAGRFANLSTRAQVGGTAGPLTPGFVITAGSGTRKVLIRAAGPALTPLGVTGVLANPTMTLRRTGTGGGVVATNDNWSTQTGTGNTTTAEILRLAFEQNGAFPFPPNSQDAALLLDLVPGNYTVEVTGVGNTAGVAIVELYDLTPASPPTVSVAASKATADETGGKNGEFTFTRSGPTFQPLTVRYGVGGSAVNGFDYVTLSGTITIPANSSSVTLPLLPNPDLQNEGTDTVVVTVVAGTGYVPGTAAAATVTIADSSATLYVANISPEGSATNSTASGTATILLSSDGSVAAVTFNVSNLSTAVTSAHLRISPSGDFVFTLPYTSSGTAQWLFFPTGNYSSGALLAALKSGNIFVGIDTARYPTGEVRGTFIQGSGSATFTAPAAPPAVSLANVTATDAARLLTQATFGPKKSEIDALTGGSIDTWITAQMALPHTSHRTATVADRTEFGGSNSFTNWNAIHMPNRQSAWFKIALTAPDQLRQRVAYALSQIFVVSDISLGDDGHTEPLANYYDILGNGAFGNFRTLLENVTLSPMMGLYLSSLRNSKATFDSAGNALTTPDENYAREVMQLFTIGLVQLQPDGRLALGSDGLPIPTYNQTTITELAKVFTGWAYPSTDLNRFRNAPTNYYSPMQLFPTSHDDTAKNLSPVSTSVLPAAQGGTKDLQMALDALFVHPNTGPFISRLLIQRLVTSNPSPGYIYRVAQAFANDGTGTRGNLGAVVRAILTDHEARSPQIAANVSFGKLKEPLLRFTGLLRSFNASSTNGRFLGLRHTVNGAPITGATPRPATQGEISSINSPTLVYSAIGNLAQAALRSPTVFNFYHADYVLPGPLASAGLVAPEFEITDDNYAISVPNYLRTFVNAVIPTTAGVPTAAAPYVLTLDLAYEQTLLPNPDALLDHLSNVLAAGNLSPSARTRIKTALTALPTSTATLDRVKTAVLLTLTSQSAAIQK
jgi:uncharacterized protein (DUF1800 family)